MVATALAGAGVLPLTGVAVSVKVSFGSEVVSLTVARRSCTEVAPGAIVTLPVTGTQALPLNCSSAAGAAVSVPSVALPFVSEGVKTTGLALGFDSVTVKTAGAPSATLIAAIERLGVSSLDGVPFGSRRPSSTISVVTAVATGSMAAPFGAERVIVSVSLRSSVVSFVIETVTVFEVSPGAKLSVPLAAT